MLYVFDLPRSKSHCGARMLLQDVNLLVYTKRWLAISNHTSTEPRAEQMKTRNIPTPHNYLRKNTVGKQHREPLTLLPPYFDSDEPSEGLETLEEYMDKVQSIHIGEYLTTPKTFRQPLPCALEHVT